MDELAERRMAVVREHMESENRKDFAATMATFSHPRYELIGTRQIHDGTEEVQQYFDESRTAFPDQRNELISMRHADDSVIVEFVLRGTHEGPLAGIEATGREFECRMCAFFDFEPGGDGIVCERVYFDQLTILSQLTDS